MGGMRPARMGDSRCIVASHTPCHDQGAQLPSSHEAGVRRLLMPTRTADCRRACRAWDPNLHMLTRTVASLSNTVTSAKQPHTGSARSLRCTQGVARELSLVVSEVRHCLGPAPATCAARPFTACQQRSMSLYLARSYLTGSYTTPENLVTSRHHT